MMLHKCECECECVLREREKYGKWCPKSAANIALFFLPWQHWQIRQKTMAKPKEKCCDKKYEKFLLPPLLVRHLCRTLLFALFCTVLALLLYFIEIDFLGCECICASILLLLYGMLYIHISLAQSPHCLFSILWQLFLLILLLHFLFVVSFLFFACCNGKINIENGKWELQTMDSWVV